MKKKKKGFSFKKIIALSILSVILVFAAVWIFKYVYVPSGQTFNIIYTNLIKKDVKGNAVDELAELTNNGFKTRTVFTKAKDGVEYLFDVVNDGTIDAKLKFAPIYLKLDQYTKKHIEYKITYADGKEIKKGDELKSGETKTIKVSITYLHNADFATQNSQFYESNTYLMYLQNR